MQQHDRKPEIGYSSKAVQLPLKIKALLISRWHDVI